MENASKALIIAGAILLSILIIAMGVYFLNVSQEIIPENPLGDVEIRQFNSKFDVYVGENVSGSKVKTLLTTMRTHNLGQEDETRRVGLKTSKVDKDRESITATDITTASADIKTGKTYKVEETYNDNTGLIEKITITENTKSGT